LLLTNILILNCLFIVFVVSIPEDFDYEFSDDYNPIERDIVLFDKENLDEVDLDESYFDLNNSLVDNVDKAIDLKDEFKHGESALMSDDREEHAGISYVQIELKEDGYTEMYLRFEENAQGARTVPLVPVINAQLDGDDVDEKVTLFAFYTDYWDISQTSYNYTAIKGDDEETYEGIGPNSKEGYRFRIPEDWLKDAENLTVEIMTVLFDPEFTNYEDIEVRCDYITNIPDEKFETPVDLDVMFMIVLIIMSAIIITLVSLVYRVMDKRRKERKELTKKEERDIEKK